MEVKKRLTHNSVTKPSLWGLSYTIITMTWKQTHAKGLHSLTLWTDICKKKTHRPVEPIHENLTVSNVHSVPSKSQTQLVRCRSICSCSHKQLTLSITQTWSNNYLNIQKTVVVKTLINRNITLLFIFFHKVREISIWEKKWWFCKFSLTEIMEGVTCFCWMHVQVGSYNPKKLWKSHCMIVRWSKIQILICLTVHIFGP